MNPNLLENQPQVCPQCEAGLPLEKRGEYCPTCLFPIKLIAEKYRLVRLIDSGGYGNIFEAEHVKLKRNPRRAIKTIRPEFIGEKEAELRFYQEIEVSSELASQNHHIIKVYDSFGREPGLGYYYVMEFLEGQELSRFTAFDQALMPLPLCFHLFLQLCQAMDAAHRNQIVHRDLKPSNLILIHRDRDPYFLKVIDFGLAKPLEDDLEVSQLTIEARGTPAYMAPEQCLTGEIDERTDIYSMGIILYELLTGRTPFVPKDPEERKRRNLSVMRVMQAHVSQSPPPMSAFAPIERILPHSLEEVVQKALAKNAAERFSTVKEFEAAFLAALAREGLQPASLPYQERLPNHHPDLHQKRKVDWSVESVLLEEIPPVELSDPGLLKRFGRAVGRIWSREAGEVTTPSVNEKLPQLDPTTDPIETTPNPSYFRPFESHEEISLPIVPLPEPTHVASAPPPDATQIASIPPPDAPEMELSDEEKSGPEQTVLSQSPFYRPPAEELSFEDLVDEDDTHPGKVHEEPEEPVDTLIADPGGVSWEDGAEYVEEGELGQSLEYLDAILDDDLLPKDTELLIVPTVQTIKSSPQKQKRWDFWGIVLFVAGVVFAGVILTWILLFDTLTSPPGTPNQTPDSAALSSSSPRRPEPKALQLPNEKHSPPKAPKPAPPDKPLVKPPKRRPLPRKCLKVDFNPGLAGPQKSEPLQRMVRRKKRYLWYRKGHFYLGPFRTLSQAKSFYPTFINLVILNIPGERPNEAYVWPGSLEGIKALHPCPP